MIKMGMLKKIALINSLCDLHSVSLCQGPSSIILTPFLIQGLSSS